MSEMPVILRIDVGESEHIVGVIYPAQGYISVYGGEDGTAMFRTTDKARQLAAWLVRAADWVDAQKGGEW